MTSFRTPDEPSGSPLARELLALGRSEQASAALHERAAQAGLRALSGTGAAAGATAGWLASGVAAKLGAAVSLVALGVGLWFAIAGRQGESSSKPRPAEPSKAALAGNVRPADAAEANAGSTASLSVSDLPMEIDSVSPSARSEDELGREIALLDRAKALLVAGDAKGAVRVLSGQQLRILGPEALALKVEALIVGGDALRARRLATQFLERYPSSPLARRVEELRKSLARPRADEPSNAEGHQP